ncbi:MAG: tetratricopeptide repeat protein [Planctomycetota bacterium]
MDPLLRALDKTPEDKKLARDAAWACWGASRSGGAFARAYLEDALRIAKRAEDPRMVADLEFDLGNYDRALAGYRALPDDADSRYLIKTRIAYCLAATGKEQQARAAHGEALDEAIRKNDLASAFRSAFAAKQTGKLLAWLDQQLKENPEDANLRLHRGYAREALGMWGEAAEDLRVAVRLAPGHADAQRRLARALVYYGTREQQTAAIDEAEKLARAALKETPRDPMSWETMRWLAGWAWANRDVPRSLALLEVLHDIDPEDRDIGLNYCAMARRLGRYKDAEAAFLVLLEVDDEDKDVINDYAILKDGMGDEAAAIKLWRRVLELAPKDPNALENLFTKAWERGDAARSKELLARGLAVARAGDNPGLVRRWNWFRDRLRWAPSGHRSER